MAELTKAAKATSARARARANAAAFRDRERKLEELAIEYFTYADELERIHSVRDREVAAAEEKAARSAAAARRAGDEAIAKMAALDVSRAEVASRLACTPADVRRAIDAAGGGQSSPASDSGDVGPGGGSAADPANSDGDDIADAAAELAAESAAA